MERILRVIVLLAVALALANAQCVAACALHPCPAPPATESHCPDQGAPGTAPHKGSACPHSLFVNGAPEQGKILPGGPGDVALALPAAAAPGIARPFREPLRLNEASPPAQTTPVLRI